jgi:hypothetical protein
MKIGEIINDKELMIILKKVRETTYKDINTTVTENIRKMARDKGFNQEQMEVVNYFLNTADSMALINGNMD